MMGNEVQKRLKVASSPLEFRGWDEKAVCVGMSMCSMCACQSVCACIGVASRPLDLRGWAGEAVCEGVYACMHV